MKIRKQTIHDVSQEWAELFSSMEACNYYIGFCVIKFDFCQDIEFFTHDLGTIMKTAIPHSDNIDGDITTISLTQVKEIITNCLSFTFEPGNPQFTQSRLDKFWKLTETHFSLPPCICYQHIPNTNSYFDFGIMWNFCFILLNEQNQGIIIYAGASD